LADVIFWLHPTTWSLAPLSPAVQPVAGGQNDVNSLFRQMISKIKAGIDDEGKS
jgi:hypothetical protein